MIFLVKVNKGTTEQAIKEALRLAGIRAFVSADIQDFRDATHPETGQVREKDLPCKCFILGEVLEPQHSHTFTYDILLCRNCGFPLSKHFLEREE